MNFNVSLIPGDVKNVDDSVFIVIDVLRASSTMVTLLDKGCTEIILTDNVNSALKTQEILEYTNLKVCSEDAVGQRAVKADFSPSLIGMENLDFTLGESVLMQTTNGTTAIHSIYKQGDAKIYIGCMLNAKAVMEEAIKLAKSLSLDINIVCAGRDNSTTYTIDDVYCAAKLLKYGENVAKELDIDINMYDSAKIALILLNSFGSTVEAFEASASGRVMRSIDCNEDIHLCSIDSITNTIPYVSNNTKSGHIIVKAK